MQISSHGVARLLGECSSGPGPAHRRLADLIRLLIVDGRLPLATSMPGERDLAAALGVSRTTVSTAYTTLREQGYLSTGARMRGRTLVPSGKGGRQSNTSPSDRDVIDFSYAAPSAPGEALHRAFSRALEQLPHHLPHHGYGTQGLVELREAVAQRYTQRGLATTAEQILITNGAQHAVRLVVGTLLRPRERVVVDHPTYPHALRVLDSRKCRIVPIAVTDSGWDLENLTAASRESAMAYLLPDFHNPTGLCLSDEARARLSLSCPVIVDETMAELALDVRRPVPLAARHAGVITIGSADKTFWGGLRVGWVRADADVVQRLAQARPGMDLGTPVLEQLACAELLGEIDQILPGRLDELRQRRTLLRSLVAEHLPDWTIGTSMGGLSVWARLAEPISSALAAMAPQFGVRLAAGPRFGVGGAFERFVRLPYSMDPTAMTAGIIGIAEAVSVIRAGRRAASEPSALA